MKLFEATVRRPDGSEFKDRVGATMHKKPADCCKNATVHVLFHMCHI